MDWKMCSFKLLVFFYVVSNGCIIVNEMGVFQNEWRAIGVQQSRGWVHYAIHRPEPHIMLFRRPLNFQQQQQENQAQGIMAKWKEVSTSATGRF